MSVDLKNYICTVPFESLEIHGDTNFMCCASWLLKSLNPNTSKKDLWNSEEANDIRKSVSDGSYRYCDKTQCPYLSQLITDGRGTLGPIKHVNNLPRYVGDYLRGYKKEVESGPKTLQLSFDRTCNYKCPSCRTDMIVASSKDIEKINSMISELEDAYSSTLEMIYCSGTADPFASVSYRNFLRNFNPSKYPKLDYIHLHTNASLWDEKMWNSMVNIHPFVKTCEISIDAGTKETYENVTRLGGNWETLIDNLKFISTIDTLKNVKCSFVVQNGNYKEMETFTDLMTDIFGKKGKVFFGKINNWGTFTDEVFSEHKVWDINHPNHQDFIQEFNKVARRMNVFHNLHEFIIEPTKTLI